MPEPCPFSRIDLDRHLQLCRQCTLDGQTCPPDCFLGDYQKNCPAYNDQTLRRSYEEKRQGHKKPKADNSRSKDEFVIRVLREDL